MRANFARHARHLVVRRANAPSCALYAAPTRRRQSIPRQVVCRSFERTFLDILFRKAPREIRQPEYEPGWMQIMVWRSRMLDNLRPPSRKELKAAWQSLMSAKLRNRTPLNSTQALQCRRLLVYLSQTQPGSEDAKKMLAADLDMARKVLLDTEPNERSREHRDFARALHNVWTVGDFEGKPRELEPLWKDLMLSLSRYGGAKEALEELYAKWDDPKYTPYTTGDQRILEQVAQGLALEGREKELIELVEFAERNGVPYTPKIQEVITVFFAQKDRVKETQSWFTKQLCAGHSRPQTYLAVASFARRNKLEEWARPFFLDLGKQQPRKTYWDALFQGMLVLGMRLEDVQSMMAHMVGQNGPLTPDKGTVNSMLRAADELGDTALARQILETAVERSITLNGETYLVLLSLHIQSGSAINAAAAHEQLHYAGTLASDATALWKEYEEVMNRFLTFLCSQRPPDFKLILKLLETVEEEQLHLQPETVAALCLRFLENDQTFDVMDILSVHAFLYSEAQRAVVQNSFVTFCLDPETSTSRAWGAYQLLQQFFQDLSRERRVLLLEAFFNRKRPDMATFVFGHMRQHRNKEFQPTLDIYVQCFEGFAQNPDRDGTEQVHNMLKMDTRIQKNTKLNTALMLAYAACDRPLKALDFWQQIIQSPEGPSYGSLEAVFWTLERKSGGGKMATEIWEKLDAMDVEVSPAVFNAYVGAIAASGNEMEVGKLLQRMKSYTGSDPDAMTIGVAFNAFPGEKMQQNFKEWSIKRYRQAWADLHEKKRWRTEFGLCRYKLDRVVRA